MRSLARQSVAEMGGRMSVLTRQKSDHVRLDHLLRLLADTPAARQDLVLLEIYRLVFPHAFAEEAVLWPVIRRVLPDGHALTLRVELEHQEINELVARVESLPAGSAERQRVLDRVVALLQADVRDEEDLLLPRLQQKLDAPQLRRLGLVWEAVRQIAPTRAHPIVARRPPGNILSALPLSLIDRCRDTVDVARNGGAPGADRAFDLVSDALRWAGRAVEALPGMRSGEDPATRVKRKGGLGWKGLATGAAVVLPLLLAVRRRRRVARLA